MKKFWPLSFLPAFIVLVMTVIEPWEWSFMMDDISYRFTLKNQLGFLAAFQKEFWTYWDSGRFYPFKYFINLLKWRELPYDPLVFHFINLLVLFSALAALSLMAKKIEEKNPRGNGLAWILPWAGLALAKPVLEIITFNSLGEGWLVLFLGWGFFALAAERTVLARILFLLAGLSKEPGIFIFFGLGLSGLFFKERRKFAVLDFVIFSALLFVVKLAMRSDAYLTNYSILSVYTFVSLAKILLKNLILFSGLLLLFACNRTWLNKLQKTMQWMLLAIFLFMGAYLAAVAGRGTAGYLTIPPTFCLLAVFTIVAQAMDWRQRQKWLAPLVLCLGVGASTASLIAWWQLNRCINEASSEMRVLLDAPQKTLLLINGQEAREQFNVIAAETKSLAVAKEFNEEGFKAAKEFAGPIELIELKRFFGPIIPEKMQAVETARKLKAKNIGNRRVGIYRLPALERTEP